MIEQSKPSKWTVRALVRRVVALYPLVLLAIVWEVTAQLGLVRGIFLPRLSTVIELNPKLAA